MKKFLKVLRNIAIVIVVCVILVYGSVFVGHSFYFRNHILPYPYLPLSKTSILA